MESGNNHEVKKESRLITRITLTICVCVVLFLVYIFLTKGPPVLKEPAISTEALVSTEPTEIYAADYIGKTMKEVVEILGPKHKLMKEKAEGGGRCFYYETISLTFITWYSETFTGNEQVCYIYAYDGAYLNHELHADMTLPEIYERFGDKVNISYSETTGTWVASIDYPSYSAVFFWHQWYQDDTDRIPDVAYVEIRKEISSEVEMGSSIDKYDNTYSDNENFEVGDRVKYKYSGHGIVAGTITKKGNSIHVEWDTLISNGKTYSVYRGDNNAYYYLNNSGRELRLGNLHSQVFSKASLSK